MHSLNPRENKRKLHPGGVNSIEWLILLRFLSITAAATYRAGTYSLRCPPPLSLWRRVSWLEFGCTPLKLRSVGRPIVGLRDFCFPFLSSNSVRSFLARSHQQYANTPIHTLCGCNNQRTWLGCQIRGSVCAGTSRQQNPLWLRR